MFLILL